MPGPCYRTSCKALPEGCDGTSCDCLLSLNHLTWSDDCVMEQDFPVVINETFWTDLCGMGPAYGGQVPGAPSSIRCGEVACDVAEEFCFVTHYEDLEISDFGCLIGECRPLAEGCDGLSCDCLPAGQNLTCSAEEDYPIVLQSLADE